MINGMLFKTDDQIPSTLFCIRQKSTDIYI